MASSTKLNKSKKLKLTDNELIEASISAKLSAWSAGEAGFYQWLSDIRPKILTRSNKYEEFKPTAKQKRFIKEVLKTDKKGRFKHSIAMNVEPRRHGKSTIFALLVLWFFTSRRNFTVGLLGATEDHAKRVQFNTLKKIINASPKLRKMIPESNQYSYTIVFPFLSNQIQYSASNLGSSFGDRLSILWVSDLHSFLDLSVFNAQQASLLDSEDSLLFIDSNVDSTDQHVHGLQKESETDPGMFCQYTSYRDFVHFSKSAPTWIDRKKAQRLEKTTLPADFKRDILGQRSDAKNALFSSEIIEQCKSAYRIPVTDLEALTRGRAYKVGGGLDRAKSLIAGPRGDYTVWTVILKLANPAGEPEYFILNQKKFLINSSKAIKKMILEDHQKYNLDAAILENYEVSDIYGWMLEKQIPCELMSAVSSNQESSFPEMFRIFSEGRFHYPAGLEGFSSELATFAYTRRKNGTYSFGHSSQKFHDDTVYSTNWAIFSLRKEVLNLYEIDSIQCGNRSQRRHLCFLMGGNLELFCKENCPAYLEVKDLYNQFRAFQLDSDLTIAEFFQAYVRVTGAIIYQAV